MAEDFSIFLDAVRNQIRRRNRRIAAVNFGNYRHIDYEHFESRDIVLEDINNREPPSIVRRKRLRRAPFFRPVQYDDGRSPYWRNLLGESRDVIRNNYQSYLNRIGINRAREDPSYYKVLFERMAADWRLSSVGASSAMAESFGVDVFVRLRRAVRAFFARLRLIPKEFRVNNTDFRLIPLVT